MLAIQSPFENWPITSHHPGSVIITLCHLYPDVYNTVYNRHVTNHKASKEGASLTTFNFLKLHAVNHVMSTKTFIAAPKTLILPTQSLPAGDTSSPTALGSGTHTDTQHTVTGECVHYCEWGQCGIKTTASTGSLSSVVSACLLRKTTLCALTWLHSHCALWTSDISTWGTLVHWVFFL